MIRRNVLSMLLSVTLLALVGGCDYQDGTDTSQWKIPITEAPECLRDIVAGGGTGQLIGIPLYVYRYQYQGEYFYYLYADCCDQYNYLLDGQCGIICAPDGGFSGAGDGQCPDYYQYMVNTQELIWCKDDEICGSLEYDIRA